MRWIQVYGVAALALTACTGDDGGSAETGGTGTGAVTGSTSAGPGGTDTGMADDSSGTTGAGGSSDGGSSSEDDGGSSSESTGEGINCADLAPIADPPDPPPPAGACGYVLPAPNRVCGPQPLPGSMLCAASSEVFDPFGVEDPDLTDFRCAAASSGGYCLEMQPGLYTFCTMAVDTLADFMNECIQCLIEVPVDTIITVSWEEGPVWDAPECV